MANPQKEDGCDPCIVCEKLFHISDPKIFDYSNGKSLCVNCWSLAPEGWGAIRKKSIIFEYVKVHIPHKLKWEVWKRDAFKCVLCGTQDNLSVDHIRPESLGGELKLKNLQTLCRSCNSKKSNHA